VCGISKRFPGIQALKILGSGLVPGKVSAQKVMCSTHAGSVLQLKAHLQNRRVHDEFGF
jgi:hypothetical protein